MEVMQALQDGKVSTTILFVDHDIVLLCETGSLSEVSRDSHRCVLIYILAAEYV